MISNINDIIENDAKKLMVFDHIADNIKSIKNEKLYQKNKKKSQLKVLKFVKESVPDISNELLYGIGGIIFKYYNLKYETFIGPWMIQVMFHSGNFSQSITCNLPIMHKKSTHKDILEKPEE